MKDTNAQTHKKPCDFKVMMADPRCKEYLFRVQRNLWITCQTMLDQLHSPPEEKKNQNREDSCGESLFKVTEDSRANIRLLFDGCTCLSQGKTIQNKDITQSCLGNSVKTQIPSNLADEQKKTELLRVLTKKYGVKRLLGVKFVWKT